MEEVTTTVLAKPWYASKTLWLNLLGLIVLVLGVIVDNAQLIDLPSEALGYLGMALAIGNAILRFSTAQPLAAGANRTAELPAPLPTEEIEASPPQNARG